MKLVSGMVSMVMFSWSYLSPSVTSLKKIRERRAYNKLSDETKLFIEYCPNIEI